MPSFVAVTPPSDFTTRKHGVPDPCTHAFPDAAPVALPDGDICLKTIRLSAAYAEV